VDARCAPRRSVGLPRRIGGVFFYNRNNNRDTGAAAVGTLAATGFTTKKTYEAGQALNATSPC